MSAFASAPMTRRLLGWGVVGRGRCSACRARLHSPPVLAAGVQRTMSKLRGLLPGVVRVAMAVGDARSPASCSCSTGCCSGRATRGTSPGPGVVDVAVYLPLLWLASRPGSPVALWWAFGLGYIGARAVTLGVRALRWRWLPA